MTREKTKAATINIRKNPYAPIVQLLSRLKAPGKVLLVISHEINKIKVAKHFLTFHCLTKDKKTLPQV